MRRRAVSKSMPGSASHASPRRAARSIATLADAPIHTSIGSGGNGAMRLLCRRQRPSTVTTFAAPQRANRLNDSSNIDGRSRMSTPMPLLWRSSPPMPHCMMKRPRLMHASVAVCSATSTGFHSGNRYNAPAGAIAPLREQAAEDRRVLVVRSRRHVMIADEQRLESGVARRARLLDHVPRADPHVGDVECTGDRNSDPHVCAPKTEPRE